MPAPLKPRDPNAPVTGPELANLIDTLTREAQTLRRSVEVLANRLPQAAGRPQLQHFDQPGENKPLALVRGMRAAIRECDDALADIRWVRSRFDAWANGAYLSDEVKAWIAQGEEKE